MRAAVAAAAAQPSKEAGSGVKAETNADSNESGSGVKGETNPDSTVVRNLDQCLALIMWCDAADWVHRYCPIWN